MWYTLHRISDGEFLSASALRTNLPDPLGPDDAIKEDLERMDKGRYWDTATLQWEVRPAPRVVHIRSFLEDFTDDELFAFGSAVTEKAGKIRNVLQTWKDAGKKIDLDSARTSTMMQFLVDDGIVTSDRRDAILA
jgi:hypothetical protein